MHIFTSIFGSQNHVSLAQECARSALIFFYGLFLLRLSGKRTFGRWSALDIIVSIIVGSSLSRALTGNSSLPGTLAAMALLVLLHNILAHAVARFGRVARFVEGRPLILIESGEIDHGVRAASMISQADLREALHQAGIDDDGDLSQVKTMRLEPKGTITIIKQKAGGGS